MKCEICPECKEIILENELRGSSQSCHACNQRRDRIDLISIDTDSAATTSPNVENRESDAILKGRLSANSLLDASKSHIDASIPRIHSQDELKLFPGASWTDGDSKTARTLVIQTKGKGSRAYLFGAIVWLVMVVPIIVFILLISIQKVLSGRSSVKDVLPVMLFLSAFLVPGIILLILGIRLRRTKIWIEVDQNFLRIERGTQRKGNTESIPRMPIIEVISSKDSNILGTPLYSITLEGEMKYKVAGGLGDSSATEIANLIKTLLVAKIS